MWRLLIAPRQTTMRHSVTLTNGAKNVSLQKASPMRLTDSKGTAEQVQSKLIGRQMQLLSRARYFSSHDREETVPPRIKAWLDRKSQIEISTKAPAKEILLSSGDLLVDEFTKDNPLWLDGVLNELKHQVPVGKMSERIYNCTHTVMRWLRSRGDSAQKVEDLLRRLIEEEDHGMGRRVTSVCFSLALDAWAKEKSSDAPQRAENLLQLMHARHEHDSTRPVPLERHVSQVIVAWSYSSLPYAPQRAEQLLKWMEGYGGKFAPSVHAYTSTIHAYAQHGMAEDAERILRIMEDRLKDDPKGAVRPNVITFSAVINAWANSGKGEYGAQKAEHVCARLEEWYNSLGDECLRPNVKLLGVLMHAWVKSNSPENVERVFRKMHALRADLSETERSHPSNQITCFPYNLLIEAWAGSGNPKNAENVLNGMLDRVTRGDKDAVVPNNVSWTLVARGWGKIGNMKRTEFFLKRMHKRYIAGDESAKTSLACYNSLLLAYGKQKKDARKGAAEKAQHLIEWMEEQAKNGMPHLHPNVISYGLVIHAWRGSGDKRAGRAVLQLLHNMEKHLILPGKASDVEDSICTTYEEALATIAKGNETSTHLEVLNLLHHMEALDKEGSMGSILSNKCYHTTLMSCAWSPSFDGEELAEEILRRMEESTNSEYHPFTKSYDAVISGWARSSKKEAPARAYSIFQRMQERAAKEDTSDRQPSDRTYNHLLVACLKNPSPETARIAHEILETMKRGNRNGLKNCVPCPNSFRKLFGTASFENRDRVSAIPVEDMIQRMEESQAYEEGDIKFLASCYFYAFTVWSWSVDPDAVLHTDKLWKRVKRSKGCSPTVECFNAVLRTYASNPDEAKPTKAEAMLRQMETDFLTGYINWCPDSRSYNNVIDLWAKSKLPSAPEQAFQLLERMVARHEELGTDHVKPNRHAYAGVLLACALTPAQNECKKLHLFNLAVRTFNHLREKSYCEPDPMLYNRLLMCATYHAPNEQARAKMTKHIFSLCCRDGCLDGRILKHYWDVAPKQDRLKLLSIKGDKVKKLSDLPQEWSVNAKSTRSSSIS